MSDTTKAPAVRIVSKGSIDLQENETALVIRTDAKGQINAKGREVLFSCGYQPMPLTPHDGPRPLVFQLTVMAPKGASRNRPEISWDF